MLARRQTAPCGWYKMKLSRLSPYLCHVPRLIDSNDATDHTMQHMADFTLAALVNIHITLLVCYEKLPVHIRAEVLLFPGCAVYVDSWLRTVRDNISVPSSNVR